jgi:hypothetical protein
MNLSTVFTPLQIIGERRGQLVAESGSFMLGGEVGS